MFFFTITIAVGTVLLGDGAGVGVCMGTIGDVLVGIGAADRFPSQVTQKCPRIRFAPVFSSSRNSFIDLPPAQKQKDGKPALQLKEDLIQGTQKNNPTMVSAFLLVMAMI